MPALMNPGPEKPFQNEVRASAPGRVNLLGEHTDYTGGLVLPVATEQRTEVTVTRRSDGQIEISSTRFPEPITLPAKHIPKPGPQRWANYVLGVIAQLWSQGDFRSGFKLEIGGNLPMGSGLGASAALAVACARALNELFQCGLADMEIAIACQKAEHNFVGVQCGIMDQAAASFCKKGHALLLNCKTLQMRHVPLPPVSIVVIHCGVSHELAESEYNRRVSECSEILNCFLGPSCLGELGMADLAKGGSRLSKKLKSRLEHIIGENERVRRGVSFLEEEDLVSFGRLMFDSHASLRDLYEVSSPELDSIVETLRPLAYGAKMTGAGFGGAVVGLIDPGNLPQVTTAVYRGDVYLL